MSVPSVATRSNILGEDCSVQHEKYRKKKIFSTEMSSNLQRMQKANAQVAKTLVATGERETRFLN